MFEAVVKPKSATSEDIFGLKRSVIGYILKISDIYPGIISCIHFLNFF